MELAHNPHYSGGS